MDAAFFHQLADAAARETLPRFRRGGAITNKLAAGFDPVTEADQQAERAIRSAIEARYPAHGILGEEYGEKTGDGRHAWVIDPIDGTRAFISGLPVWGTLVGLLEDGDAVSGMMAQPFTGELFWADAEGAHYEGPDGARDLSTRKGATIADSVLFTTTPALYDVAGRRAYDRLEGMVRLARYGADCYAFAMLAAGHVDLVVEGGLQPYDIVALIPIIEKAGGVITTWDGEPAEDGGDILAAATTELHAAALAVLNA